MFALDLKNRFACWWMILRTSLAERLAYRGDFALGTLMRFLPIITQIFLWWAIFDSAGVGGATQGRLAGYSFPDMVAYYLLSMLARAFSSMPGLASSIAKQVREGEIKKFITQPIDMLGFTLISRCAHKIAYYTIATLPFALVFFLCRHYFTSGWPSVEVLIAFVLSLLMAFLLGYLMDACIGLVGFWFLEVSSLLFVYMLLNFFLSGHMFPLDLLPNGDSPPTGQAVAVQVEDPRQAGVVEAPSTQSGPALPPEENGGGARRGFPFRTVVNFLPFKYLAYFPAAIFLGKVEPSRLWFEIGIEVAWLVFFIALARFLYARGLKRYSGYGG
jgi:ABC-2 type transport system permease protein